MSPLLPLGVVRGRGVAQLWTWAGGFSPSFSLYSPGKSFVCSWLFVCLFKKKKSLFSPEGRVVLSRTELLTNADRLVPPATAT